MRAAGEAGAPLPRFGEVVIDLRARTVTRDGKPVKLTHLEFELLTFFCRNEDRVFSREELLRAVWGLRQGTPARTVDNFVAQLRAKLETDPESPRPLPHGARLWLSLRGLIELLGAQALNSIPPQVEFVTRASYPAGSLRPRWCLRLRASIVRAHVVPGLRAHRTRRRPG